MPHPSASAAVPEVWFRPFTCRGYPSLWMAQLISSLGDWVSYIIVPILLYQKTQSALSMGGLMVCRFLPRLLFVPIAEKVTRTQTLLQFMLASDLLRAVAFLGYIWADSLVAIYALNLILASGTAVFRPCKLTLIAHLLPKQELMRGNSYLGSADYAMMLLGPLVGAWLLRAVGLHWGIVVNSVSFVLSFALLLPVLWGARAASDDPTVPQRPTDGGPLTAHAPRLLRPIVILIVADAIAGSCFGALNALLPIYANKFFTNGTEIFGYVMSALGCGLLVGTVLCPWLARRAAVLTRFALITLVGAVGLWLFGSVQSVWWCLLTIGIVGAATSMQDITVAAFLQSESHGTSRTNRLLSIHQASLGASVVLALVGSGYAADVLGVAFTLQGLAIVAAAAALPLLLMRSRTGGTGPVRL